MNRLAKHIGVTVFAAIAISLVAIVGLDVIAGIIDQIGDIKNNYYFADVLIYVATKLPSTIYEYIPLSSLIGCLVGLGILASHSEVIIMRASGVSLWCIISYVLRPVLVFILLGIVIGEYFSPYLDQLAESRRDYLRKGESGLDSSSGFWKREGNEYMHFNAVFPGGVLFGVTRFQFDDNRRLVEASFSSRATHNATEDYWVEENVSSTVFLEESTRKQKFVTREWFTDLTPEVLTLDILPADSLSIKTLYSYIDFLEERNFDTASYRLALWDKVLHPFAVVALVLVGISFIFGPLREATMGYRIFVGVLFGISFRLVQDILGPLSIVFNIFPIVAVLIPIAVCACLGLFLLKRSG